MPRVFSSSSVLGSLVTVATALLFAGACSSNTPSGAAGASDAAGSDAAGSDVDAGAAGAGTAGAGGIAVGGGGGTASAGSGGGPVSSLWTLTPATSPLTVTFTLETAAKVVKDVPLTGGSLKAVAKDGTTFELTVPGDALFSPQTISMTPVIFAAQPFGQNPQDPAWGVQLLPDGLVFNKPVTLLITPPGGAPPVKQQVPFGWSGAANQVVLANPDPKDARLALKLLHFSSYAYATATQGLSASLAGVRNRIGGSAEDRITSAFAELLSAAKQSVLLGASEEGLITRGELDKWVAEYDKEVVQVRIAAAGSSCAAGRLAINTVLGAARQKELLGVGNASPLFPTGLIDTVDSVCLDEEWGLCRDQHIIQRLIPVFLLMERQHQLLGIGSLEAPITTKALGYIYKCLQFELDVTSATGTTSDQWTFREPVQGQVKMKLSGGGAPASISALAAANISGTGVLFSQSYSMTYPKCTGVVNIVQIDPRFVINGLTWDLKGDPTLPGKGEIKDFNLPGAPGMPSDLMPMVFGSTHVATDLCGMPPAPPETIPNFNWFSVYAVTMGLNPAYFSDISGWYFDKWEVYNNGGALLAKKVIDEKVDDDGIHYTAATTLLLTHKPAP